MIRPAILADMWALRRKPQRRIFFYSDALLASSYHPYFFAWRGMLRPPGSGTDRATLVLRDHGLRGYLQACRRPNRPELDLQYLTSFTSRGRSRLGDGDIFFRLIEDLLKRAGSNGIERVFATLGARATDAIEVLRQLGFQPYAQQSVWMLSEPVVEAGSSIVALRRQRRQDAWAIHQLYTSLTPRHVQQAELRDSACWHLPRSPHPLRVRERGWVLGDDQALTVHIHVRTGSRGHVLQVLVAPHLQREIPALVRYVLSQLQDRRPIFAVIRSYQGELRAGLEELGFMERGEQTIFVRQLAILKRHPLFLPALLRPEQVETATSISTIAALKREADSL